MTLLVLLGGWGVGLGLLIKIFHVKQEGIMELPFVHSNSSLVWVPSAPQLLAGL